MPCFSHIFSWSKCRLWISKPMVSSPLMTWTLQSLGWTPSIPYPQARCTTSSPNPKPHPVFHPPRRLRNLILQLRPHTAEGELMSLMSLLLGVQTWNWVNVVTKKPGETLGDWVWWVGFCCPISLKWRIYKVSFPKDVRRDFSAQWILGRVFFQEKMEARKYHFVTISPNDSLVDWNSGICTGKGFDYIRDYTPED